MARFDDGVKRYIKARAVVEVGFPVDWRDSAEIACKHCQFIVFSTRRCGLTQTVVNFPEKYVGHDCPLEEIIEEKEVNENV
jgi:hypothetical protein